MVLSEMVKGLALPYARLWKMPRRQTPIWLLLMLPGRAGVGSGEVAGLDAGAHAGKDVVGDIGVEVVVDQDADAPVVGGFANILEAIVANVVP